jgi:flagellar hook-length control protein FliK
MLNLALPVANGPQAATPACGAPPDDAGPAFARALDQATARQREATPVEGAASAPADATLVLATGADPLPASELRPGVVQDSHARKAAGAADPSIQAQADAATPGTTLPDTAPPAPAASTEDATHDPAADAGAAPAELLAWVASLPLPPPAPVAASIAPRPTPSASAIDTPPAVASRTAATTPALPTSMAAAMRQDDPATAPTAVAAPQAAAARKADAPSPRNALPSASDGSASRVDAAGSVGHWLQTSAAPHEAPSPLWRVSADNAITLPSLPAGLASAAPRRTDGSTPLQAELRAEVGSREFAPALGSQLSVLVRDGIEHAQLKLNPAEMGPIEVRISVDGSQAQVDFSAAQAQTRQALQDAVPALANALRESGLTLTGGGVFEQPRESRDEASAHGRAPQAPEPHAGDDALPAAAMPRLPRARGVLDLYA